jgi:hypothetical protein
MEYRTKVTTASTILAVLCLTAVFGTVFSQQAVNQRQEEQPLLAGFDPAVVTGLELADGVELKKTGSWSLSVGGRPYPASSERIDGFVKSLALLKRDRLVSGGGDAKPFGLDQGFKTLKVLGASGKVIANLEVGTVNEQGKVFVRLAGAKDIWETDSSFARSLTLDFNTWADLSLFPKKTPTRIAFDGHLVTADKTAYVPFDLVLSSAKDKDGKAIWQNRLTKANVDAASWVENFPLFRFGAFASPLDPPADAVKTGTLTVGWSDGTETKIIIGKPDTQNRYRSTDGTKDFWINDWSLAQLLYK